MSRTRVSLASLLRTVRAPFAMLILAAIALLVPPQTADMLAALPGFAWPTVSFHAALAGLALSAWYWSRALVAARFDVPDLATARQSLSAPLTDHNAPANAEHPQPELPPGAFDLVPRLMYLLAVLIGLGVVIRSNAWSSLPYLLAWSIPLGILVYLRTTLLRRALRSLGLSITDRPIRGEGIRSTPNPLLWLRQLGPRFRLLILRAPFPSAFSLAMFVVSMLMFAWGVADSFVVLPPGSTYPGFAGLAARAFPGPAVAMAALAFMIAPLSVITFLADGLNVAWTRIFHRPPVVCLIVGWSLLAPFLFSLHTVRVIPPSEAAAIPIAGRAKLEDMLKSWAAACGPSTGTLRPIIVAVSGGATRAAIWAARILTETDQASAGTNAHIFAVSSVSGGSLGAAAYIDAMASLPDADRCANTPRHAANLALIASPALAGDAIAPVLAGALLIDTPRTLLTPIPQLIRRLTGSTPRGGDRAEAIERGFEHLWQQATRNTPAIRPFSAPYLSLFYQPNTPPTAAIPRPGMPIWIANGTDLDAGSRMLTVPFNTETWPFLAATDALSALGADVPVSTAINNTARFPFLEPAGELLPVHPDRNATARELIDGGYFENEGMQTALELADWLHTDGAARLGRAIEPIIVQATADGEPLPGLPKPGQAAQPPPTATRCDSPNDDAAKTPTAHRPLQVLAPVLGLYNVRGGHSAVVLREARQEYCKPKHRFFHFLLTGPPGTSGKPGPAVPLNWVLSNDFDTFIKTGAMQSVENTQQATDLKRSLGNVP